MVIAFVIWSIVAMILIGIGINCRKADDVVGFFTFTKPPIIEDVKAYNKEVGVLWLVSAIIFELLGVPLLLLEQNSPLFIPVILSVMVWVIALMVAYLKIETKYKK